MGSDVITEEEVNEALDRIVDLGLVNNDFEFWVQVPVKEIM